MTVKPCALGELGAMIPALLISEKITNIIDMEQNAQKLGIFRKDWEHFKT